MASNLTRQRCILIIIHRPVQVPSPYLPVLDPLRGNIIHKPRGLIDPTTPDHNLYPVQLHTNRHGSSRLGHDHHHRCWILDNLSRNRLQGPPHAKWRAYGGTNEMLYATMEQGPPPVVIRNV